MKNVKKSLNRIKKILGEDYIPKLKNKLIEDELKELFQNGIDIGYKDGVSDMKK